MHNNDSCLTILLKNIIEKTIAIFLTVMFLDSSDKTRITRDCLHVRHTSNGVRSVRQHAAAILDSMAAPPAKVLR